MLQRYGFFPKANTHATIYPFFKQQYYICNIETKGNLDLFKAVSIKFRKLTGFCNLLVRLISLAHQLRRLNSHDLVDKFHSAILKGSLVFPHENRADYSLVRYLRYLEIVPVASGFGLLDVIINHNEHVRLKFALLVSVPCSGTDLIKTDW